MRGSGSPGAGCSLSASTGSRLSQYGSDRSAGSADMRLCRCVVPVRGRPQMTIGALDPHVVDLGMAAQEILDEQPVLEQLHQERVVGDDPGCAQPRFGSERGAQHVEPLTEAVVAEVGQARSAVVACVQQRFRFESQAGRPWPPSRSGSRRLGREARLGEVVDADRRRARAARSRVMPPRAPAPCACPARTAARCRAGRRSARRSRRSSAR